MTEPLWSDERITEWLEENYTWPSDLSPYWKAIDADEVERTLHQMRDEYEAKLRELRAELVVHIVRGT